MMLRFFLLFLFPLVCLAEPATEETLAQLNEFLVIVAYVFSFCMGAVFGNMR